VRADDAVVEATSYQLNLLVSEVLHLLRPANALGTPVTKLAHNAAAKSIQTAVNRQHQVVLAATCNRTNLGFCQIIDSRSWSVIERIHEDVVLLPS